VQGLVGIGVSPYRFFYHVTREANDLVPESDISTQVVSDKPVICERAMYWQGRDGGHDTIGVRGE